MTKEKELGRKDISIIGDDTLSMLDCYRNIVKTKLDVLLKFDMAENILKLIVFEKKYKTAEDESDIPGAKEYKLGQAKLVIKHGKDGVIKRDTPEASAFEAEAILHREEHLETAELLEKKKDDLKELLQKEIEFKDMIVLKLDRFPKELEQDITPIMALIER